MKKPSKKQFGIGAVIVLAVVCAGVAGYFLFTKSNNSNKEQTETADSKYSTCDDEEFNRIVAVDQLYLTEKFEEFKPIAEKVQDAEGHEASPNCMFIVTMYTINSGDKENIAANFDALKSAYAQNGGYIGSLKEADLQTPDELEPIVKFMTDEKALNGQPFEWSGEAPE